MTSRTCCVCKIPTWLENTRSDSLSVSSRESVEDSQSWSARSPKSTSTAELASWLRKRWTKSPIFSQNPKVSRFVLLPARLPFTDLDYGIPKWFLNRQRCIKEGTYSQLYSNMVDTRLREDLERMKKVRKHRGLRHFWGLKVRGQKTKSTGRTGKTLGVAKKKKWANSLLLKRFRARLKGFFAEIAVRAAASCTHGGFCRRGLSNEELLKTY